MTKVYVVGGAVRDQFLGRKLKDIDIAVECKSFDELEEYVTSVGGDIYVKAPDFLTIRARVPKPYAQKVADALMVPEVPCVFDFAITRSEGAYSDGRHPDEVTPTTIYEDLKRRDFTMNAMAIDIETGEMHDPFHGRSDMMMRLVKCPGKVEVAFKDDALRMLRAIRFSIVLDYNLDVFISDYIYKRGVLTLRDSNVSDERIYEELRKSFDADTMKTLANLYYYHELCYYLFTERGIKLAPRICKCSNIKS